MTGGSQSNRTAGGSRWGSRGFRGCALRCWWSNPSTRKLLTATESTGAGLGRPAPPPRLPAAVLLERRAYREAEGFLRFTQHVWAAVRDQRLLIGEVAGRACGEHI